MALDHAVNVAFTLSHLEDRLRSYQPASPDLTSGRRAAVAALCRFDRGRPEVLLMKRSERAGDRWSGHVSFPGGHEDTGDADLVDTAIRETLEEVGIDLRRSARLLGRLDAVWAMARGRVLPMIITPFVFAQLEEQPVALQGEAVSTFWLPLDLAASGALDASYQYRLGPVSRNLPCWRHEGYVVWGLTYRMLSSLLAIVAP